MGEVLILTLRITFSVTLGHTFYLSGPVSSFGRRVGFLRTLLALRIGESSEAAEKMEGTEEVGTFSCHQGLKISRECCPLPSPFSGQGSLSFLLAHLLSQISLRL